MSKILTLAIISLICINGASTLICTVGQQVCGTKCYYPIGFQCIEGQICKIGQSVCGGECYYDAGLHICLDGHLCNIGQKLCNQECYYPMIHTCVNRRWLI